MTARRSDPPLSLRYFSWNNENFRAIAIQVGVVAAALTFISYLIGNAIENIHTRGLTSGFAFLGQESGFSIVTTLIPFTPQSTYGSAFIVSMLNTLLVAISAGALATFLGILVGVGRLSTNWLTAKLSAVYVETFRNIPLLVLLFFWYFSVLRALPPVRSSLKLGDHFFLNNRGLFFPRLVLNDMVWSLIASLGFALLAVVGLRFWARSHQNRTGRSIPVMKISVILLVAIPGVAAILSRAPMAWDLPTIAGFNVVGGMSVIPEFLATLVAISIYTSAYIAEIVRGGILSVNKGQAEAALSLGLSLKHTRSLVVMPQALRTIIPPSTTQYLNLVKNTSLAGAIGYPDLVLVFHGTVIGQTGQAIEVIFLTLIFFLTVSLLFASFMNLYNSKVALKGH